MADIIKEIMKDIPPGKVAEAFFEGANIVLYTKDKEFFLNNEGLIKSIVNKIKKRIELRPHPSMCVDSEKTEELIKTLVPVESKIGNIIFDPQRSRVIIEAENQVLQLVNKDQT